MTDRLPTQSSDLDHEGNGGSPGAMVWITSQEELHCKVWALGLRSYCIWQGEKDDVVHHLVL